VKNFIDALNSINSQVWAFLMLVIGLGSAMLFHKIGLDIAIAAGVIGAAVQLFQSTTKTQVPDAKPVLTIPETPSPTPVVPKEHL